MAHRGPDEVPGTATSMPYVERGEPSGTPTLLLHPWGESRGCFDRLLPMLDPTIRAFAMDQRGHGQASKPVAGYALQDFADDVVAFLDLLQLPAAVLVGSSSGGYVAQQVAVSAPERVLGVVLIGSPRSLYGRTPFADELADLADPVDRAWVAATLEWFPRHHEVPAWYLDDRVEDGVRMPARVWQQALAGLTGARPPTEQGTITAPTLVIWGERDELLPRAEQESLVAALPDARIEVYEETGHLVLWEQPERIAADVNAFISVLSGRSS